MTVLMQLSLAYNPAKRNMKAGMLEKIFSREIPTSFFVYTLYFPTQFCSDNLQIIPNHPPGQSFFRNVTCGFFPTLVICYCSRFFRAS